LILFLNFLFLKFFGFLKDLASNAQANPNIEKRQLLNNSAKNLIEEKYLSFNIYKTPKSKASCQVFGMSFVGSWVSSTEAYLSVSS